MSPEEQRERELRREVKRDRAERNHRENDSKARQQEGPTSFPQGESQELGQ
jgi:hypothetical protein